MSETDDIVAIQQLRLRYLHAYDECLIDEVLELLTEDVEVDASGITDEVWAGTEAAREGFLHLWSARSRWPEGAGSIHSIADLLVEVDGDTATARYHGFNVVWRPSVGVTFVPSAYLDSYRRVGGAWRISAIRKTLLFRPPAAEPFLDVRR